MSATFLDRATARQRAIAAWRYLAFLDLERRRIVAELRPDLEPGGMVFVPCDRQVFALMDGSPLGRAARNPMTRLPATACHGPRLAPRTASRRGANRPIMGADCHDNH